MLVFLVFCGLLLLLLVIKPLFGGGSMKQDSVDPEQPMDSGLTDDSHDDDHDKIVKSVFGPEWPLDDRWEP
jgi:hypothetical protein